MRPIHNIKFVDLREGRSVWDPKKSDPKKGLYEFTKKEYVTMESYHTPGKPDKWYGWCEYNPRDNYRVLMEWKSSWGYEEVVAGKDPIWPEAVLPDANGYYREGDLIFVQCPLENYLAKRDLEVGESEAAQKSHQKRFEVEMAKHGAQVDEAIIQKRIEQAQEEEELKRLRRHI